MSQGTLTLIGFVSAILPSFWLGGLRPGRSKTVRDFFWADRENTQEETKHLYISTSLALGNAIVYLAWLGYQIGIAALWIQLAWCCGFVWLSYYTSKIVALSGNGTMHGNISRHFGAAAGKTAAIASIIGFLLNFGWELMAGISIFKEISENEILKFITLFCLALVAATYSMLGGLRGNVRANIFQNRFAYVSLVVFLGTIFFYAPTTASVPADTYNPFSPALVTALGIGGLISNVVLSFVWQFVDMSGWENIAAANKNRPEFSRQAVLRSALWLFFLPGLTAVLAGAALRHLPGLTPNNVLTAALGIVFQHPVLYVIVVAGFVCAMLSTVDGFLIAATQALSWDLVYNRKIIQYVQSDGPASRDEKRFMDLIRFLIVLLAVAGAGIIFVLNQWHDLDLFNLVYLTYSAQIALFPSIYSIPTERHDSRAGALSIIAGLPAGLSAALLGIVTKNDELLTWAPCIGLFAAAIPFVFSRAFRGRTA